MEIMELRRQIKVGDERETKYLIEIRNLKIENDEIAALKNRISEH